MKAISLKYTTIFKKRHVCMDQGEHEQKMKGRQKREVREEDKKQEEKLRRYSKKEMKEGRKESESMQREEGFPYIESTTRA